MKTLKIIFRFTKKYLGPLSITVLSMLILVGVQLAIPWIIRTLIADVTNNSIQTDNLKTVTWLAVSAAGLYLVKGVFTFLRSYMAHIAGWGVVADSRRYLYQHLQRLSLRFYEDKQTGQIMSRMINDTGEFETLISHAVPDVIVNLFTFVGISIILISMNWKLGMISLIPVPFIVILMRMYEKYARPAFRYRQSKLGDLNAITNDNISGIREIKSFTREEIENIRVSESIESFLRSNLKALKLMAIFQPSIDLLASMGMVVVIYFGGILAFNQTLGVADLVAFFLYLEMLYQPIRVLSQSWENVLNSLASADRVEEFLQEEPEVVQSENAIQLGERVLGAISFEGVDFRYVQGEMVLEDISMEVPAKKVVALVGPTGVGKSTMVSLIPRFYDPVRGVIRLDGQDIRNIELESLRRQISIVLQDVFLFYGTVRENILFGNPDASQQDVEKVARIANAHDFIMDLSDGYDTLIGERGVKLSGGQKQRVSIARAVLKNAPILILDEATSSVDTETEMLIQQALERLMVGKTTIIIAHRLSTIRNADKIMVLEGTGIAEIGTHAELLEKSGLYSRLNSIQEKMQ
ncbi:MAG: ABC transporter ATP-binding protein [Anaerolineales bacterium]|nr:ABC transporter ATP-binding protein [Anaerolineales bacterium]